MSNDVVVGAHYELPDGRIVRTFGYNGIKKTLSYYFDDGKGGRTVTLDVFNTWKIRRDLKDFPNARDPLLPYVFDLLWDIKYTSDLKQELHDHPDKDDIIHYMKKYKIEL